VRKVSSIRASLGARATNRPARAGAFRRSIADLFVPRASELTGFVRIDEIHPTPVRLGGQGAKSQGLGGLADCRQALWHTSVRGSPQEEALLFDCR
jgi:hypothetical protein